MTTSGRSLFSIIGIAIFALLILGYTFFEFHALVLGPRISIVEPQDGQTVAQAYDLTGTAERVSSLFLNGRLVTIDEEGRFEERLVAPDGSFILTLTARDRFGRETITRLSLYHEQETPNYESQETNTSSPEGTGTEEGDGR